MVKEYCDRCKAEIDPYERFSKEVVKITIPSPQSYKLADCRDFPEYAYENIQ